MAEAEYAAAFGGGQVVVELTLTLTNLGHPQQSPPLLFVDNECAIGLATSSIRPKKSKSIDMRLDWLRERASQLILSPLRTWDLYYGGSTIVQFVLHKKWPKHPRRF